MGDRGKGLCTLCVITYNFSGNYHEYDLNLA